MQNIPDCDQFFILELGTWADVCISCTWGWAVTVEMARVVNSDRCYFHIVMSLALAASWYHWWVISELPLQEELVGV